MAIEQMMRNSMVVVSSLHFIKEKKKEKVVAQRVIHRLASFATLLMKSLRQVRPGRNEALSSVGGASKGKSSTGAF